MKKSKIFWVENCENEIDVIANKAETYGTQRFKISILNTVFDCEKVRLSNADNRYYYSYVFPDGTEKISRTRSDCEYCLGTDNLIFAEKQIEKNLKKVSKQLQENLKHPVMIKLSSEVEKRVKFYKSDFYHIDNEFIFKYNYVKFIIVLRESGTFLLPLLDEFKEHNSNYLTYCLKNREENGYTVFLCDMNTESVIAISVNDIANYIK